MGLDSRVWWFMIGMIILSTGLLSYRLMDHETCAPLQVTIKTIIHHNDGAYLTDEIISFNALGDEKTLTWDFDDNTPKQEGKYVTHRFSEERKYNVKITNASGCETFQPVLVKKAPRTQIEIDSDNGEEKISGHTTTLVGAEEKFFALVKADSYEWNVLQHPKYLPRKGDSTKYVFSEPGDYTIELTLNNDRSKKFRKMIHVDDIPRPKSGVTENIVPLIPPGQRNIRKTDAEQQKIEPLVEKQENTVVAPPKVEPVKRKTMFISDETFTSFLQSVLEGQKDITDFNQYLFFEGATKVQVNGEKDFKTFTWLYQEFKGKGKKIKLKTVQLLRDENENVFNIKIDYKKKGFLGL
ncbi:MAG: hypothetical protein JWP81_3414 [Ferruginibacter sp.]|nr:hypothetical protein [Ferruginibacter sp.]